MKPLLSLATVLLLAAAASAQTDKKAFMSNDTSYYYKYGFNGALKDSGRVDYGTRLYDPRILRYMPTDTGGPTQNSPYGFTTNNPIVLDELPDSTRKAIIESLDYIPFSALRRDTTGMSQYGMRYYDARVGRYLPMDAVKQPTAATTKKPKKKTTSNK